MVIGNVREPLSGGAMLDHEQDLTCDHTAALRNVERRRTYCPVLIYDRTYSRHVLIQTYIARLHSPSKQKLNPSKDRIAKYLRDED